MSEISNVINVGGQDYELPKMYRHIMKIYNDMTTEYYTFSVPLPNSKANMKYAEFYELIKNFPDRCFPCFIINMYSLYS